MSEFLRQAIGGLAELMGAAESAGVGTWPGLLAQLETAGLGANVRSWLGEGENMPVTADELSNAFTPQQLQAWAERAGTTPDVLLHRLAEALPHAVSGPADKLPE